MYIRKNAYLIFPLSHFALFLSNSLITVMKVIIIRQEIIKSVTHVKAVRHSMDLYLEFQVLRKIIYFALITRIFLYVFRVRT